VNTSNHNYFTLLELTQECEIDTLVLEKNFQRLQSLLHPDRFVNADATRRLLAIQQSSILNDGYKILKSPLHRAEHLLQLQGIDTSVHKQIQLDGKFLIAQMEMREDLENLLLQGNAKGMIFMQKEVKKEITSVWAAFKIQIMAATYMAAKAQFHKLQFLYRLHDEIRAAEDKLLDT